MTAGRFDLDHGWEIQDPFYNDLYHRSEHLLRKRQNAIHTRISYHLALKLLDVEGGDARIVLPAIILHDVGYSQIPEIELRNAFGATIKKPELRRFHEVEGARLAEPILQEIAYPPELVEKILLIIEGHDTREAALDIGDMIVKDADKLCRFTYEGFHIDVARFNASPQIWLNGLIGYIPEWFFTKTAEKLAMEEAEMRKKDIEIER
jgi:HD superfamily phosphodiesterase